MHEKSLARREGRLQLQGVRQDVKGRVVLEWRAAVEGRKRQVEGTSAGVRRPESAELECHGRVRRARCAAVSDNKTC